MRNNGSFGGFNYEGISLAQALSNYKKKFLMSNNMTKPQKRELASYEELSRTTGKTYRTVKKLLSGGCVVPVLTNGRAIMFDRVAAIEAIERPDGDPTGMHPTPLVCREWLRGALYGTPRWKDLRETLQEILWFVAQKGSVPLLHHKLRISDPDYRPLTDSELDRFDKNPEMEIDPEWTEIGQLIWSAIHKHDTVLNKRRNLRVPRKIDDPQAFCDNRIGQFINSAQQSLETLHKELSRLASNDQRIKMNVVDESVINARKKMVIFVDTFFKIKSSPS